MRAGGSRRKEKAYGGERRTTSSVNAGELHRREAVYMYEVARVHVKMCAVGARARAFDCREQAKQGREKVKELQ